MAYVHLCACLECSLFLIFISNLFRRFRLETSVEMARGRGRGRSRAQAQGGGDNGAEPARPLNIGRPRVVPEGQRIGRDELDPTDSISTATMLRPELNSVLRLFICAGVFDISHIQRTDPLSKSDVEELTASLQHNMNVGWRDTINSSPNLLRKMWGDGERVNTDILVARYNAAISHTGYRASSINYSATLRKNDSALIIRVSSFSFQKVINFQFKDARYAPRHSPRHHWRVGRRVRERDTRYVI